MRPAPLLDKEKGRSVLDATERKRQRLADLCRSFFEIKGSGITRPFFYTNSGLICSPRRMAASASGSLVKSATNECGLPCGSSCRIGRK